jgi:hypothetical protein
MNISQMFAFYVDMGEDDYQSDPWTLTKIIIIVGHVVLSYGLAYVTVHYLYPKWAPEWKEKQVGLTMAWVFILLLVRWKFPSL